MAILTKCNADDLDKSSITVAHERDLDPLGFCMHLRCALPARMKIVAQ